MTDAYLDISKSVIISSPAGSGKTEKLSRRYISLLEAGSDVEKILCITFTEKAAAEMKDRILSILIKEKPSLLEIIVGKIPLMRISTIHAFCLRLLKRFSKELGLDPSLSVMDEHASKALWTEAVYEVLTDEKDAPAFFFDMIKDRGLRGWDSLSRLLYEIHEKSPYPEMLLKEQNVGLNDVLVLYGMCLSRYKEKKKIGGLLDYCDLEILAFESLSKNAEWSNILYAFDEHTDHILVDEFQDTSTLQWEIIEKLTEEWRSGLGAKRDRGKLPTLFLVGDDKQSIYRFRGANVNVFREAAEKLSLWMGEECSFIQVKENYRSLPAIVDFANRLFSNLMPVGAEEKWKTRYAPFEAVREEDRGKVELLLISDEDGPTGERLNTKSLRTKEADAIAKMISALDDKYEIFDDGKKRPCRLEDMAILLRKRTHLGLFEDALRKAGIPFVVLKGIGFYEEPETALLRELISFLVDPLDDYSLFCVLRSPLFSVKYKTLSELLRGDEPLIEKLRKSDVKKLNTTYDTLTIWINALLETPVSGLLEKVLVESGGWEHLWERQRHANIKKFISLVESHESMGLSAIEIRDKLLRQKYANEVSKANINAEGMNAVRIMTVHAAKGLQFPMVFLPSLEESIAPRSTSVAFDEEDGKITLHIEEYPDIRRRNENFMKKKEKDLEEEKRLFYVAVTRARDYLCMSGATKEGKAHGRLKYIDGAFQIIGKDAPLTPPPFDLLTTNDIDSLPSLNRIISDDGRFFDEPSYTEPIAYRPSLYWRNVTEDTEAGKRHGEDWAVIGSAMHRLFEELSNGRIEVKDMPARLRLLLPLKEEAIIETILHDFKKLEETGHLKNIILPCKNAYSELPIVLEKGKSVFKGRIDRLILSGDEASVYDYKTFPVKKEELPELVEKYRFQMELYREAVETLFSVRARSFLLFTHLPEILEVSL